MASWPKRHSPAFLIGRKLPEVAASQGAVELSHHLQRVAKMLQHMEQTDQIGTGGFQIIDATGRPLRGAEAADTSLPVVAPSGGADGAIDPGVLPPL